MLLLPFATVAQTDFDADARFSEARGLAFAGHYADAIAIMQQILAVAPAYHDVRVFYARTLAWEKSFDSARLEVNKVLEVQQTEEAWETAIDIETWSHQFDDGLSRVNDGLRWFPNSEGLLYRKAVLLHELGMIRDASDVLAQLLAIHPSNESATRLMQSIKAERQTSQLQVSTGVDVFSRQFDPAYYAMVQAGHTLHQGTVLARANYSHRFSRSGVQVEVDAYPRISGKLYGFLNYGYSGSELFPKHRMGVELFAKLPANLELSAGYKYLQFTGAPQVNIFTGSLNWYVRQWLISYRPYVVHTQPGFGYSSSVSVRYYMGDAESFLSLTGTSGFAPDDRRLQSSSGLSGESIARLGAQRVGLMYQQKVPRSWIIQFSVFAGKQELSPGNTINVGSVVAGLRKRF